MTNGEDGTQERSVAGRRYARAALGAAVAGLIALVALGVAAQPATSTTTPLSTRVSRWAVLGTIIGLALGATVLAASRHRNAPAARWVATLLLGGLMLFFLAPGLVFMPAVALMLLAAVAPNRADQRSADPAPGTRRTVSPALAGGLVSLLLVAFAVVGVGWRSRDGELGFACTLPASETIVQTTGIRPDDVTESSGAEDFSASATHEGRTVVFVTCDPASPGSLDEVTGNSGATDHHTADGVPFTLNLTAGDRLPVTVRFVHRDALITISAPDTLDVDQAGRLVDSWIIEVAARGS